MDRMDMDSTTDKHTPGPWRLNAGDETRIMAVSKTVADAKCGGMTGIRLREAEANARMIAAAPDMMAALQYAVDHYGKPGGPWNVPSDPGGWLDRARDAIGKAKDER
jgi:hypothetical protein